MGELMCGLITVIEVSYFCLCHFHAHSRTTVLTALLPPARKEEEEKKGCMKKAWTTLLVARRSTKIGSGEGEGVLPPLLRGAADMMLRARQARDRRRSSLSVWCLCAVYRGGCGVRA